MEKETICSSGRLRGNDCVGFGKTSVRSGHLGGRWGFDLVSVPDKPESAFASRSMPTMFQPDDNPILADGGHWIADSWLARCGACGGLHPAEAIRLLRTDGTKFASTPWKDGWPHLFQIETQNGWGYNFYTIHLKDASSSEIEELGHLFEKVFGVTIIRCNIEGGPDLWFFAPPEVRKKGIIWGEIVNGEPNFSAMEAVNGKKK